MGVVRTILLVAFIIVCVLTILLVLMQNDEGNGMGTAFGGGQSAAFGSHSASVLVKTTGVLAGLFFVIVFVFLYNEPPDEMGLGIAKVFMSIYTAGFQFKPPAVKIFINGRFAIVQKHKAFKYVSIPFVIST